MVRQAHHERLSKGSFNFPIGPANPLILSLSKDGAGWFDRLTMSGYLNFTSNGYLNFISPPEFLFDTPRCRKIY